MEVPPALCEDLRRLARRVVGCPDLAEDVVQEALIALWQADDVGAPRAWLTRVVSRRSLQRLRTLARRRRHECRHPGECVLHADPAAGLQRAEARERLLAEIARLPAEFRAPLELRELEGLSYDEVAEHLGLPLGTVRSRLARARRRLREALLED